MTYDDGRAAMVALQGLLQEELNTTHAADFADYGGADVVLKDDEPDEPDQVGKPYIVMNVERDELSSAIKTPGAWDASFGFDVMATPFSGATTGEANPEGSDTKLSRTIRKILLAKHDDLKALGLYRVRMESDSEIVDKATEADPTEIHTNQHRIRLTYFTD